jgi:hypothetical protein
MQVGFSFCPYTLDLCESRANRYGYAMIGIADTPRNAMDICWFDERDVETQSWSNR